MTRPTTPGAPRRTESRRWKRGTAAAAGVALVGTVLATGGPAGTSASSHREAPLIAGDPRNDNTDVYAFVSPDAPDTVTMIANWLPFEEPNGGPNFYPWADDSRYNIKIDNDGDAVPDITYQWVFTTQIRDDGTFLANTGPVTSLDDPDLNYFQTYDLIKRVNTGNDADESNDTETIILDDVVAAPSVAGEVSTPDYETLVDQTIAAGTAGALKSFVGQADDSFFLDLRVFDLLYGAGVKPQIGEDTLGGYNVNTIALQVPKTEVALAGNATDNPVVGLWSTTDKESIIVDDQGTADPADDTYTPGFVQVSRLGNPLVNEVVLPLALKDAFNSIPPTADATIPAAVQAVTNPILPPLVQAIYGQPVPGDTNNTPGDTSDDEPRTDLAEIFLQGVSVANGGFGDPAQNPALAADLNSLALNAGVAQGDVVPSEMLRLNMAVPVTAEPNSAGVIGGDLQGFPNGRRLADDIVDAALAVVEGVVYEDGADVSALGPFDSVDENDVSFRDEFPYVALPHIDSVNNGPGRPTPRATEIISFNPVRILETRGGPLYEQVGYSGGKPQAGDVVTVKVAGVTSEDGEANVPTDAKAVYLNVTATNAAAQGVLKVFPCGQPIPNEFSNANPDPSRTVSALTPAVMDDDGNVCIYTKESTDLIVDVSAYHPVTSQFTPIVPERVLETRTTEAGGQIGFTGAKPADQDVTRVQVTGTPEAGLPDGTKAVIVNLTSVNTERDGFVTAYSCDVTLPQPGSNLNTVAGAIRSNPASVAVSESGEICLYTKGATDLVVDLMGAAPAASSFVPTTPKRILETRASEGRIGYTGSKPIAGQIIELKVEGAVAGLDADVDTVVLNVTGTENEKGSFITVFPCGNAVPNASNVNVEIGTEAGLVVTGLSDDGRVCLFNKASQHVIVDLQGYYPGTILAS